MNQHPVPENLESWLAGWLVGGRGNPYRRIGADVYTVYRRPEGWGASIGRTHSQRSWSDPEAAKVGLYEVIRTMAPGVLDRAHAGTLRRKRTP